MIQQYIAQPPTVCAFLWEAPLTVAG